MHQVPTYRYVQAGMACPGPGQQDACVGVVGYGGCMGGWMEMLPNRWTKISLFSRQTWPWPYNSEYRCGEPVGKQVN